MLVRNWMTKEVITITPDTSLLKLGKLMHDSKIRRLPVVDGKGHVIGIVFDRDVRDASPSNATTLDMYEMRYLLAELKASSIMTPRPLTVKSTDTVENAAMIMLDNRVGGLPVVEENGDLVGIITDHDVFMALVDVTSAREGGIQFGLSVPNVQGGLRPVFDILRKHGARILSVLSNNNDAGQRNIFIRIREMESRQTEDRLIDELRGACDLQYWARNQVHLV